MSQNPLRQKLMSPTDYIARLVGYTPPEPEQQDSVFDAVYRVLPQRPATPMPFPESPPPYPVNALGAGSTPYQGWGQ